MSEIHDASATHDVAIIGGGPGGSTAGEKALLLVSLVAAIGATWFEVKETRLALDKGFDWNLDRLRRIGNLGAAAAEWARGRKLLLQLLVGVGHWRSSGGGDSSTTGAGALLPLFA